MIIQKFGGTSVGSPERIKEVGRLINDGQPKIVVLSAMSGTTNKLVEIAQFLYVKKHQEASQAIEDFHKQYHDVVEQLFRTVQMKQKAGEMIDLHFNRLMAYTQDLFTIFEERAILALGELISTALLHYHLEEGGVESVLLPALNFMRIDKEGEPDEFYIKQNIDREFATNPGKKLFITQGFICRNAFGEVDNLKRGGSDYTASIIGAAVGAEEIQIWTDIDGFHNNDPRYVKNTKAIERLSFEEAAELAYFGAKILHPASVTPAKQANIPVRLKNTMNPDAPGTLLTAEDTGEGIKAIAAKDGITAVKIRSGRMLLAYGFMRKVFEIFETYKTSIDLITTSEVTVSVTIDDTSKLAEIEKDLTKYGAVEIEGDQTIICIVGNLISESTGFALKIFDALKDIPIRMISYGGSRHNISILISSKHKDRALNELHQTLF
jgi:aspartate kinase